MTTSAEVREKLVRALRLDLVGPGEAVEGGTHFPELAEEQLEQDPTKWYLTGFLVPRGLPLEDRQSDDGDEEVDSGEEGNGDDSRTPDKGPAAVRFLPSSIGLSFLVRSGEREITVKVRWGEYRTETAITSEGAPPRGIWMRRQREEIVRLKLPLPNEKKEEAEVPAGNRLMLVASARPVRESDFNGEIEPNTSAVSVFLVNDRLLQSSDRIERIKASVFQAQLEIDCAGAIVPRPTVRGSRNRERDEQIADLQYSDAHEYAVGHNVSAHASFDDDGHCTAVRTCWIPGAYVSRVTQGKVEDVPLSMDELGTFANPESAVEALLPLVTKYREWIRRRNEGVAKLSSTRAEVAHGLLESAEHAAKRIEEGIRALSDPKIFQAFTTANRAMATQARRRRLIEKQDPSKLAPPAWRPFQLAFILLNIPAIANPSHPDREVVDLLFFPTGGGKTEAYLGIAAFTLVYRRLSHPGIQSAGLSVLMRYTLRLLTLDQLSRASTLICALELDRRSRKEELGEWPFEIGLWVGSAATPNRLGAKGDSGDETAVARVKKFLGHPDNSASPIPLESCPWCGSKFSSTSFQLEPNPEYPRDLWINCANELCDFTRGNYLPLVAVDEPIYRRLPCFMIATVDKFAALPWTGESGQFFGNVDRYDRDGFYGEMSHGIGTKLPEGKLPPPDLIIQDELHLISGPLGTIAGLYEAAIDELSAREVNGKRLRVKVIASTATVRQAGKQVRALFGRAETEIFPPPGMDRRDSFFAKVHECSEEARLYLGIAAQGRSPKVIMLKVYAALLSAARWCYLEQGGDKNGENCVDPYLTLLGYFNSLRELGGARRIVDDEVSNRVREYSLRHRLNQSHTMFADRELSHQVEELTSRASTAEVAVSKDRLDKRRSKSDGVDVALATNMISVGLDIQRLGLMVVMGQPLTTSEYIQATSRVGRDYGRPGLVVTLLNIHKPRDRSHYERFQAYHETFYRNVEATSVTPYSPRALDRALAAAVVSLARHGWRALTCKKGANKILPLRTELASIADYLSSRAEAHDTSLSTSEQERISEMVRKRVSRLLDEWNSLVKLAEEGNMQLSYNSKEGGKPALLHQFLDEELKDLDSRYESFRANRSMRDVEPNVNLFVTTGARRVE